MPDRINAETRSRVMSAIGMKNTKIEIEIRQGLFAHGFRFRLHVRNLPGRPDVVLPKYSTVVFINGCFWHSHNCSRATIPETRKDWWKDKLEGNKARDAKALVDLKRQGWRVLVVWECAIRRHGINRKAAILHVCILMSKFLKSKKKLLEISGQLPNGKSKRPPAK